LKEQLLAAPKIRSSKIIFRAFKTVALPLALDAASNARYSNIPC
jgi:hypothetical protein